MSWGKRRSGARARYRGAAFPDHSRFAALAGGTWVDGSGISGIRIISDAGEVMGKRYFDGEIIEGMGFSPDGRVLSVSLLAPRTGSGSGSEGRQRTLLLGVAPHADFLVDLVELRSVERPVKTIRFFPDSRTIDIDGQLFSVGRVIADEPLAIESLKQVQFSDDSSRMNILSGEDRWSSVDTATGLETEGGATVAPAKPPPPEITAAKASAHRGQRCGECKVQRRQPAHHSRRRKRGRGTSHLDQGRRVRADRAAGGGRPWRRVEVSPRSLRAPVARMDARFLDCRR
jgi:hypothetical protein